MPEKLRILVVDDDRMVRGLLEEALTRAGYEVETASSGDDALEMVRARRYDLVTTDKRRPGMDGYTLRERIHDLRPWLPVVLITSDSDMKSTEAVRLGFIAFLPKPFDVTVLTHSIGFILERTVRRADLPAAHAP